MVLRTPVCGELAERLEPDLAAFVFKTEPVFHPGLVLERYLPFNFGSHGPARFDSEQKGPWLRRFADRANQAYRDPDAPWRRWSERNRQLAQGAGSFLMKPRWRWVVGLGNQTVLETGITLHHVYGVPYTSGSALKGLTQAMVELDCPTELNAEDKVRIFGEQPGEAPAGKGKQAAGEIVFVGVFPEHNAANPQDCPRLVVDVMTPHFPKYYQGERQHPLEVEDPTPIPFLVVAGGTYRVTVVPRRPGVDLRLVELAECLCRTALKDTGIGGKTAKGYGYFVGDQP